MTTDPITEAIADFPVDAIDWHEGMLLAPQHFQQFALRQDMLLQYHATLMSPWHWGVLRLRIDLPLLSEGLLRIAELDAVMPDGLLLSHTGRHGDLQLDLTPFAAEIMRAPLRIHLAVASRRATGCGPNDLRRYRSLEGHPVLDQSSGEGEVIIPRLIPLPVLLPGATPPQKFVSFPLLEIDWRNEVFSIGNFIPPTLRVEGGSALGTLCAQVITRVREKARYLSEQTFRGGEEGSGSRSSSAGHIVAGLVSGLPWLEAVLGTQAAHPVSLYQALANLAGTVATAGSVVVPPPMPPFRHNDLLTSFVPIAEFILNRLESFQLAYREVPFQREQGNFQLALRTEWQTRRLVIGVRRNIRQTEAEAAAWLENALLGGSRRIASLNARRILGLKRTRIQADDELSVESSAKTLLFAIESDPEVLEADDPLIIYNPGLVMPDTMPAEIVLFVHNTSSGAREDSF